MKLSTALLQFAAVVTVSAQGGPWAQCAGQFNGPLGCVAGWACIWSNDEYAQCLEIVPSTVTTPPTAELGTECGATEPCIGGLVCIYDTWTRKNICRKPAFPPLIATTTAKITTTTKAKPTTKVKPTTPVKPTTKVKTTTTVKVTTTTLVTSAPPATTTVKDAGQWGQCGGQGWSGPRVCPSGWTCIYLNTFHDQCLQSLSNCVGSNACASGLVCVNVDGLGNGVCRQPATPLAKRTRYITSTTRPSPATTLVTSASTTTTSVGTAPIWGQCGGIGWIGPTVCPSGWACIYSNDEYFQCNPLVSGTPVATKRPYQCNSSADCPSGNVCVSNTGLAPGECRRIITPIITTSQPIPTTTTLTSASPTATSAGLAPPWGQCGGFGWTGPTVCVSGWDCIYANVDYSQCFQVTTATTTKVVTPSSTPTSVGLAPQWGQCGGLGWTGPTQCVPGNKCIDMNFAYSQCQPDGTPATTTTTAPAQPTTTPVTLSTTSSSKKKTTTKAKTTTKVKTTTTRSLSTTSTKRHTPIAEPTRPPRPTLPPQPTHA